ncbi:putative pppde peptidase domain-containing 2, partial [Caulochytrium protostelioides]
MAPSPVSLFIYDLSNGLARQLSVALTGAFFPAIYHTGVVIFNREYFFGGNGIQSSAPGASPYGTPIERRALGNTTVTPQAWNEFLRECNSQFGIGAYHLLTNNCNTFSDAACQFLV